MVPSICSVIPICGDGKVNSPEDCDDGIDSIAPHEVIGCDIDCIGSKDGWLCTGGDNSNPSSCSTICGDGRVISPETCDDAID